MKSIIIIISILTIGGIIAIVGIGASNKEISLRGEATGQQQIVEAYFDKMWKIISQKGQVANEYKQAFKEIYPALIEGRYGNEKGGSLMKFIVESNPQFDVSLYKDLMQSIEAERTGFFMEQKKLIDIAKEHNNHIKLFPNSMFVGSRPEIIVKVISSGNTKKVMETGEDNDIEVFKK